MQICLRAGLPWMDAAWTSSRSSACSSCGRKEASTPRLGSGNQQLGSLSQFKKNWIGLSSSPRSFYDLAAWIPGGRGSHHGRRWPSGRGSCHCGSWPGVVYQLSPLSYFSDFYSWSFTWVHLDFIANKWNEFCVCQSLEMIWILRAAHVQTCSIQLYRQSRMIRTQNILVFRTSKWYVLSLEYL